MKSQIEKRDYGIVPILSNKELIAACVIAAGAYLSPILSMIWGVIALGYGLWTVIQNDNEHDEAIVWSAYMAGLEVVLRGTGGSIIWEFGKYSVILLLIVGMIVDKRRSDRSPVWIVFVGVMLIPGIVTTFSWSDRIAEDISFNISGILCLLVSSYYFSTRHVTYLALCKMMGYFVLPVISLVVVIFLKSPSLQEINFKSTASFAASGGFGPNQVATILGVGWLLVLVTILKKEKLTSYRFITYLILGLIIFRSLLTFSRGGNVAAFFALMAFIATYLKYDDGSVISRDTVRNLLFFGVIVILIGYAVNEITGGMFENRILGLNGLGESKTDMTSGRIDLIEEEFALFKDDPLGVGVGGSSYFRDLLFDNPLASHNEFGRLISEHGVLGIAIILILIIAPLRNYLQEQNLEAKAFGALFFVVSMLTAMHSALRVAMPAFFYGMSFLMLVHSEDTNIMIDKNEQT